MKSIVFIFFFLSTTFLFGQTDSLFTEQLSDLLDENKFQEILDLTAEQEQLSQESLYLRGCAFFFLEKEEEALQVFEEVIKNNKESKGARYYKSAIHLYRSELDIALSTIEDLLNIENEDAAYHYLHARILDEKGEVELAKSAYQKSMDLENTPEEVYLSLANIYFEKDQLEQCLEIYKEGVVHIEPNSSIYEQYMYNMGLVAYLANDFSLAKKSFEALQGKDAPPFLTSMLIQAHYALEEYEQGNSLKPILYEKWKNGTLPEDMKNDFLIDKFEWNGQTIMVYEKFDESKDRTLFYKHVFYVFNEKGLTKETIQTEWSAAMEMNNKEYVLGRSILDPETGRKLAHYSYFGALFDKEVDYQELKKSVLKVLENRISPSSSSTYGNADSKNKKKKKKRKEKKKKGKKI